MNVIIDPSLTIANTLYVLTCLCFILWINLNIEKPIKPFKLDIKVYGDLTFQSNSNIKDCIFFIYGNKSLNLIGSSTCISNCIFNWINNGNT